MGGEGGVGPGLLQQLHPLPFLHHTPRPTCRDTHTERERHTTVRGPSRPLLTHRYLYITFIDFSLVVWCGRPVVVGGGHPGGQDEGRGLRGGLGGVMDVVLVEC